MNGIYFVSELLTFGIFAVLGLSARRWDDAMGRRVRTVSAAACGISLPMALVSLFCLLARPAWGRTLHRAAGPALAGPGPEKEKIKTAAAPFVPGAAVFSLTSML